eukprot:TRINITY_DN16750_c0_g1_i2.p2 TRINITY_DN16750_c0_g1~~TRINITY_DN16750_c0_g1_i2.p2  ORF type:complete len:121 (+),score=12.60 TRINITY_DN16750_c0_g1_i2:421-783(+)
MSLLGTDVASWVTPHVEGNCPSRKSATLNAIENEFILFGGRLSKGGVTNEMYTLKTGGKCSAVEWNGASVPLVVLAPSTPTFAPFHGVYRRIILVTPRRSTFVSCVFHITYPLAWVTLFA